MRANSSKQVMAARSHALTLHSCVTLMHAHARTATLISICPLSTTPSTSIVRPYQSISHKISSQAKKQGQNYSGTRPFVALRTQHISFCIRLSTASTPPITTKALPPQSTYNRLRSCYTNSGVMLLTIPAAWLIAGFTSIIIPSSSHLAYLLVALAQL